MLPSTADRVWHNTAEDVREQIQRVTEQSIARYSHAPPEVIDQRLAELDHEWDIERTLEANAATAVVASVLLGVTVNRKFLYFPLVVGGFLLQHALQGWCPPLPIFRRMGIRTAREIDHERDALRRLREQAALGQRAPRYSETSMPLPAESGD